MIFNLRYLRRLRIRCTRPVPITGPVPQIRGTAWATLDRQTGGIR